MIRSRFFRTAAFGLAALALFSLVFSLLAERDLWPRLPAGALHDTDLAAGFAVAAGLVFLLARRRRPEMTASAPRTSDGKPEVTGDR